LAFALDNKILHVEITMLNWCIENNMKFLIDDEFNIGCNWDDAYFLKIVGLIFWKKKNLNYLKKNILITC